MKLIVTVVGIIVAAIVLYLCAWLASWYKTGQPSLSELRLFVDTLVSVPAVGAIGFYSAALVDKDENGESDIAEEKASKK